MQREQVMELALHAILQSRRLMTEENYFKRMRPAANALRAALGVPIPENDSTPSTHSADCWKWHHECAIARIEELKLLCEEMLSELYVYRASEHLKDAAAAIRARGEK